jgi:hypothetical protein
MKVMIEFLRLVLAFVLFFGAIALYSGTVLPKRIRYDRVSFEENAAATAGLAGSSGY